MAAGVRMKFTLDSSAVARLTAPGGMVDQATARAAGRVRDRAKGIVRSEGRIDTGAMVNGIRRSDGPTRSGAGVVSYTVSSDQPYSRYQHDGTTGPIYPRRAKMLRFQVGGKTVFARKVRGVTGIRFLTRAIETASAGDWL